MPASLILERSERITEARRFGNGVSKPKASFVGKRRRPQNRVAKNEGRKGKATPIDANTKNTVSVRFEPWSFDLSGHLFGTPEVAKR
jgi:hypothetical protein